ncbi:hypothetical protein BGZ61DRAFT_78349 [Ilyonectria robusta]|uniref:uncharacterized protein n=1 Tax=Ilyonectria robusta TaxID=1079257 RepID=UPI001E8D547D|nr:uncharacterized protein BGZ61DRAFT_78349 [Ilyonectria robusta]KAH8735408.1 hypothetical protein BGZ61DRAFT_78349 [Ilyonectria robusta]
MHKRRTKSRESGNATTGTGHQYRQRRSTVPLWHRVAQSQLSPIPPPSHEPTGVLRPAGEMQTSGTSWRVLGCYGSQPVPPVPESLSPVQHPTDFDPNGHRQLSPLQLAMPLKAANFLPPGGRSTRRVVFFQNSTHEHPCPSNPAQPLVAVRPEGVHLRHRTASHRGETQREAMCFAFLRLAMAVSEQELCLLDMPPLSLLATGTEQTLLPYLSVA